MNDAGPGETLRALILDLGNVLVFHDNELLFSNFACAFSTDLATVRRQLDEELFARVNRGQLPGDTLRLAIQERLGTTLSQAAFEEVWSSHFTLNQPMIDAVSSLVGRVKLVLLSNTHDLHIKGLRPRVPLLERFDGLVLSYAEGLIKPEREIYRRAISVAGVPPDSCLFFDDIAAYVDGAQAAGLPARQFVDVTGFWAVLSEKKFPSQKSR